MPTILVVDDTALAREAVAKLLEYEGFTVLRAEHGRDAWAMMYEYTPDLVLLDLMMPEMDGRNLAQWMTGAYPGIKILFMSGFSEESEKVAAAIKD